MCRKAYGFESRLAHQSPARQRPDCCPALPNAEVNVPLAPETQGDGTNRPGLATARRRGIQEM